MKDENVLIDDSVETPIVETIEQPTKKSNNELIIAIVLIVLVIGAYLLFNYLKNKKAQENG